MLKYMGNIICDKFLCFFFYEFISRNIEEEGKDDSRQTAGKLEGHRTFTCSLILN